MIQAMWAAMQTEAFRTLVVLVVLVFLTTTALCALVILGRITSDGARTLRKLHLQQSNIINMMLRAGFRPPKGKDWFDDARETQVVDQGSPYDTKVDVHAYQRAASSVQR